MSTYYDTFREDDHKKLLAQVDVWRGAARAAPRIFCGIYTHQKNHKTNVKVSQLSKEPNTIRWNSCVAVLLMGRSSYLLARVCARSRSPVLRGCSRTYRQLAIGCRRKGPAQITIARDLSVQKIGATLVRTCSTALSAECFSSILCVHYLFRCAALSCALHNNNREW